MNRADTASRLIAEVGQDKHPLAMIRRVTHEWGALGSTPIRTPIDRARIQRRTMHRMKTEHLPALAASVEDLERSVRTVHFESETI